MAAVGEVCPAHLLHALQAQELHELARFGVDVGVIVHVAPEVKTVGMARLQRQAQVLVDGEALEEVGDLERAREALLTNAIGALARNHPAM